MNPNFKEYTMKGHPCRYKHTTKDGFVLDSEINSFYMYDRNKFGYRWIYYILKWHEKPDGTLKIYAADDCGSRYWFTVSRTLEGIVLNRDESDREEIKTEEWYITLLEVLKKVPSDNEKNTQGKNMRKGA